MKKQVIALAIMLLFSPIYAGVEGTLTNHLYYPQDSAAISVNIEEEFIGIGTLKICLSNYDFTEGKYSLKCDALLLTQNISINNQYLDTLTVNLNNAPSSVYRFYLQLSYKKDGTTKTRTDCDDGNFILVKQTSNQETIPEQSAGIILSVLSSQTAVPNSEVTAYVNITNIDQNSVILLSSFIKNQTNYINENLNDDSFKVLNITKGSSAIIIMKNKILENISQGVYDYIIKAESDINTYQTLNSIEIITNQTQEPEQINLTCPECETCIECEIISCPEPINVSSTIQEGQTSKITAKLNLKRDEYYYIPAILIGLISLIIMYVKIK
ncbi:MAG: hypothetical protein WC393_03235 [Candidatus Nanoarchaeia archaeon]|jgi:hypothetical protein